MFKRKKNLAVVETNETVKSLQKIIKGYENYDIKASREITDQVFRKYVLDKLAILHDKYSYVHGQLMQAQILSAWQASNQIMSNIERLRKYMADDVYRHSTFFDANDVSTLLEVSVFYILESEALLTLDEVISNSDTIRENLTNIDILNIESDIMKFKKNIDEVKLALTDRAELIASFELVGV